MGPMGTDPGGRKAIETGRRLYPKAMIRRRVAMLKDQLVENTTATTKAAGNARANYVRRPVLAHQKGKQWTEMNLITDCTFTTTR